MAKAFSKEASKYFTDSVPNFMQCAGGLRDGTTKCAQLLRAFDSEPSDGDLQAILEIDIVNAFNSADRQAAFDTLAGTASRDYDQGRVMRCDKISPFWGFVIFLVTGGPCKTLSSPCGTLAQMERCITSKGLQGDSKVTLLRCCGSAPPSIRCGPGL